MRLNSWIVNRFAIISLAVATVGIVALHANGDIRSPFVEANAIQQQFRDVSQHAARSIYAVTAFTVAPRDAELYAGALDGKAFAAIAEKHERACGTAFAIDDTGRLLTNEHVVSGAGAVWVTDDTGRTFPAVVVGTDPRSDLAVLAIPAKTRPLIIAPNRPMRGDLVLTMGNPDGQSTGGALCVSVGNVSVADRSLPQLSERERRNYSNMIQTTTPIDVGSSGGPLLNLAGEVAGVICAVANAADQPGRPPIGFASDLTSSSVRDRVARLARGEEVVYGYLGVMVSPAIAASGVRVDRVDANTPAFGVLREGDVVLRFDGATVETDATFIELASGSGVDRDVLVKVRRGEAELDLTIRPRRRVLPAMPITLATQHFTWAGVTFVNDSAGVRVKSLISDAPLKVGETIEKVNGDAVPDLTALVHALHRHAGEPLRLETVADAPPDDMARPLQE